MSCVTPSVAVRADITVNEPSAVVSEVGGHLAIGRDVHSDEDTSAAIREGFPHSAVERLFKSSGFSLQETASTLDLSLRSLQRRKSQGRLARYESDRLYRLARLVSLAGYFLGDHQFALNQLKRPNLVLGVVTPLSIIDTELGRVYTI